MNALVSLLVGRINQWTDNLPIIGDLCSFVFIQQKRKTIKLSSFNFSVNCVKICAVNFFSRFIPDYFLFTPKSITTPQYFHFNFQENGN